MNRKYRKTIIAGNWKMNFKASETKAFAEALKPMAAGIKWCEIVLCVPAINISASIKGFRDSRICTGAQNMHYAQSGAFTGEISVEMLTNLGVKYVIIGHSERRQLFAESEESINLKIRAALNAEITPILCIGESLEQREMGVSKELVTLQLKFALSGVPAEKVRKIVIAYEPVWAIGTGRTATPEQAEEMCDHIRTVIRKDYGARTARAVSILYGGSMNDANAASLLAMPDIDGGLIGGASLDPVKFMRIIEASKQGE